MGFYKKTTKIALAWGIKAKSKIAATLEKEGAKTSALFKLLIRNIIERIYSHAILANLKMKVEAR